MCEDILGSCADNHLVGEVSVDDMLAWLDAGDPEGEVGAACLAKELLRDTYLAQDALEARRRLVAFYDHCTRSQVPELERLARTIARWETPILRWHRTRLTNAATEGTNLVIKNINRLGFGFRNFDNYRLRLLLRCGAPWQTRPVASIRPEPPPNPGRFTVAPPLVAARRRPQAVTGRQPPTTSWHWSPTQSPKDLHPQAPVIAMPHAGDSAAGAL